MLSGSAQRERRQSFRRFRKAVVASLTTHKMVAQPCVCEFLFYVLATPRMINIPSHTCILIIIIRPIKKVEQKNDTNDITDIQHRATGKFLHNPNGFLWCIKEKYYTYTIPKL
jgi:hypothetical protein